MDEKTRHENTEQVIADGENLLNKLHLTDAEKKFARGMALVVKKHVEHEVSLLMKKGVKISKVAVQGGLALATAVVSLWED